MKMMQKILVFLLLVPLLTAGADLDKASAAQQTAISELVQSLKSAQKVILTGKRSPANSKSGSRQSVFRDKQKFIPPKMPREQNPAEQLQTQIREQQQLLNQMRNTPPADSAAQEQMTDKQKQIQENVRKTAGLPSLPRGTARTLNRAQNAMKETGKMLQSGQLEMARTAGQKALSDLKQAEKTIADDADRRMRNSLSDAQRKLAPLSAQKSASAPARTQNAAQTKDSLRKLAEKLLEDALDQHKTGRQTHAEDLARLAKQVHEAASSRKPEESLGTLLAELRELRLKGKNEQQLLAESVSELRKLAQELKYTAKHPENSETTEKLRLRNDLLAELETLALALDRLEQNNGKTPLSSRTLSKAEQIASRFADLPEHGSGAAALPPSPAAIQLAKEIGTLCADVRQILDQLRTNQNVYRFQPDDIPEKYRKDVAKYFEILSEKAVDQKETSHE